MEGEPLEQALVDAGIIRLRPVLITAGAMVFALFPLAAEGGPLCFARIGGLLVATFVTLLPVPVFYAIFVLDLNRSVGGAGGGASIVAAESRQPRRSGTGISGPRYGQCLPRFAQ